MQITISQAKVTYEKSRLVLLVALTLFIGCSVEPDVLPIVTQIPEIIAPEADNFRHEFGIVRGGSIAETKFDVVNHTDVHLEVARITTSCGCLDTQISASTIPPRQSADLIVKWRTSHSNYDSQKSVTIEFSEPTATPQRFTLAAMIRHGIYVHPDRVNLGTVSPGDSPVVLVRLESFGDAENSAKMELKTPNDWLKCRVVRSGLNTDGNATRPEIELSIQAETQKLDVGHHLGRVFIEWSGEKVEIPIILSIAGPLRVTPSQLNFGAVERDKPLQRTLILRLRDPVSDTAELLVETAHESPVSITIKSEKIAAGTWRILLEANVQANPSQVTHSDSNLSIQVIDDGRELHRVVVPLKYKLVAGAP